jgi:hypothetical protein
MASAADILEWARVQLGTVEHGGPHGNDGNIVVFWDQIHHHEEQGCPWCAAFVEAGEEALGLPIAVDSAYCPTIEAAYRKGGRLFPVDQAQPGDQAFFHFPGEPNEANHTGIVESIDAAARTITCIEGNTSSGAAGSQSNGGGVYRRTRSWSVVRDVGRPAYTAPASTSTITTTTYPGDNVRSTEFHQIRLDDQGNGWVDVPGVPASTVVSVAFNGQDPVSNHGYDTPPTWDREDIAGHARVNLHGGPAKGLLDFTVWSAG